MSDSLQDSRGDHETDVVVALPDQILEAGALNSMEFDSHVYEGEAGDVSKLRRNLYLS